MVHRRLRLILPGLVLSWWAAAALPAAAMPLHPRVAADLAARGELAALAREQAALARAGLDRPSRAVAGTTGEAARGALQARAMHVAVLLVDFSDNDWRIESSYVPAHYDDLLFSSGTHPTGSLRDYYLENSNGEFDLTGQVSGWHRMPQTYRYYVAGRRATGGPYPQNGQKLVEDAVRLAEAADPSLDWRQFDNDGPDGVPSSGDDDGTVDGLIVVHAGPGYEETGNSNDVHSHFWNVVDEDLVVDGVRVFNYMLDPQDGRTGVFAHEFGHNLGLVDLYETDGGRSSVVGVWSVMSLGAWLSATGGAFGPGSGTRPSHLDAWSKIAAGFVTPVDLTDNAPGGALAPVETTGAILRLWTNGRAGAEYFLVENRAPIGFDRGLPFASTTVGGLLIWHVDEEMPTNDDVGHPRVALEQADGRGDIEADRNYGDPSDPYSLGRAFTPVSSPASRSYGGADTQVRVENLRLVGGATFAADFTVETAPALSKVRVTIDDAAGNGDGGLDATERGTVALEIENVGLDARGVLVDLESLDPRVTIAGGPVPAGDLAAGATVTLPGTFTFQVADLPADPYPLTWRFHYTASGYEASEEGVLTAGDVVGFAAGFEDDAEGFTHSAGRTGYRDNWHRAAGSGRDGGQAFRCAVPDSSAYSNLTDARLDTPVFALDGTCRLFFWHTIDAEVDAGTRAWDGGLVELSLDGGPFAPIAPAGGYPYRIIRNAQSPIADREAFSGTTEEFERVEFDLTGMTGAGRLCFHFGSDATITAGGWVVDDVTVVSPAEPYAVTFLTPGVNGAGQVIVDYAVEEFFPGRPYDGRGFNVYRRVESPEFPLRGVASGGVPPGYELLTPAPLPPDSSYTDQDGRPAELFAYLLEDLRKVDQEPRYYGPRRVYMPGGPGSPTIVRAVPSVFEPALSPATRIEFVVPPAGEGVLAVDVELRVYDLQGRLVAELVDGPLTPGKNVAAWNGYGVRGVPAPSGVYFLRLEAEGGTSGLRIVLLR